MVLSRMIYFSLQKACLPFRWKNPVDRSVLPTTFFGAPWMLLPSPVHAPSTFEFRAILHDSLSVDPLVQSSILPLFFGAPWMSLPSAVHASSTQRVWSYASWLPKCGPSSAILHSPLFSEPHECHCLALFMHPPPKEFGAMLHDFLSVDPLVQSSILHFFGAPWMSLPSVIHVSSTFESGTPRMSLPSVVRQFSILHFFRRPMNVIV